jgi:hypothetical protein
MTFKHLAGAAALAVLALVPAAAMAGTDSSTQSATVTSLTATTFSFTEVGFTGGAQVTGTFAGSDLNNDGELSSFGGEVTGFTMNFSGNSLVSAFSLGLPDLFGLVYDLNGGPLGDGVLLGMEGIGAVSLGGAYIMGPGPLTACDQGHACAHVLGAGPGDGIPEPATWALMLGGFGLAGAALRRRQSAIAS